MSDDENDNNNDNSKDNHSNPKSKAKQQTKRLAKSSNIENNQNNPNSKIIISPNGNSENLSSSSGHAVLPPNVNMDEYNQFLQWKRSNQASSSSSGSSCSSDHFYAPGSSSSSSNSIFSQNPGFIIPSHSGMVIENPTLKPCSRLIPEEFDIKKGMKYEDYKKKKKVLNVINNDIIGSSGSTSESDNEEGEGEVNFNELMGNNNNNNNNFPGPDSLVPVSRFGQKIVMELSEPEKTLLQECGGEIDIMYNFLPPGEKKELYRRAFHESFNPPTLFSSIQIPLPKKFNLKGI
jgi:hypothetical protein